MLKDQNKASNLKSYLQVSSKCKKNHKQGIVSNIVQIIISKGQAIYFKESLMFQDDEQVRNENTVLLCRSLR